MDRAEHHRRRQRLMALLGPRSAAVLPAARVRLRNRDTHYPFRQDSDFYYLTGFTEPDAVLVLIRGRRQGETILFCAEREPRYEQWHGERTGPERAVDLLGIDDAFPIDDLPDILPGLLEGCERIHTDLGHHGAFDRMLLDWLDALGARDGHGAPSAAELAALSPQLHDLRLYKSRAEVKLLERAAAISAGAHRRAMAAAQPGSSEAELEAELMHEFIRNGARHAAYPCIVAAGANALVLHYHRNDGALRDGDLVLIDAGCEYRHYASDLTRTVPVSGRFSPAQRAVYEIVLEAQRRAIAAAVPGAPFDRIHGDALAAMVDGLIDIGVLRGDREELIATQGYRPFCAHKSAHWLGLDVHDVGDYRVGPVWRTLEPGMVMAVEPGIYLPNTVGVPAGLRGIGVRIEDVVLVTRDGNRVLSAAAPKEPEAIEALMAESRARRPRAGLRDRFRDRA